MRSDWRKTFEMKSFARRSLPWIAICTLCAVAAFATVYGGRARDVLPSPAADPFAAAEAAASQPAARRSGSLAGVRARADAAFASIDGDARRRTTSRIGPQPWPADLPQTFPRPDDARVLADTRQRGDRLLLVDVPTPVDRAARDFDRALRERGYTVARADTRRVRHALHAASPGGEAVLTFLERDDATRVEILFLSPDAERSGGVRGG